MGRKKRKFSGFSKQEIEFFITFVFGVLVGCGCNISSDLLLRALIPNGIEPIILFLCGFFILLITLLVSFVVFNYINKRGFFK